MKTIRRTLALVLSMALFLSCIVVNDINVYAATTKVSKVEVTNLRKKSLTILKGKQKVLKVKVTTKDKKISKDFTAGTTYYLSAKIYSGSTTADITISRVKTQ